MLVTSCRVLRSTMLRGLVVAVLRGVSMEVAVSVAGGEPVSLGIADVPVKARLLPPVIDGQAEALLSLDRREVRRGVRRALRAAARALRG